MLLAALSTAKAEVREFSAPAAPMDAQFVYAPEQDAQVSWLALVLRKTGMDIWVLLMRDLLLMDDLDYSRAATPAAVLAGSIPIEAANSSRGGCDELTPSAQAVCELERDLVDTGWTDPASNSLTRLADIASNTATQPARGGGSFGGFTWFSFRAGMFGATGASPESSFEQPIGDDLFNAADLASPMSPSAELTPASIPEMPTPLMLLIGAAVLSLAAAAKAHGGRSLAGS